MIDYNTFPTFLFTSFSKENAPDEIPFEVVSETTRAKLSETKGFGEMFSYIAIRNSEEKRNTNFNYWLDNTVFPLIDSDEYTRMKYFKLFFKNIISPCNGNIIFKDGGSYVYILLSEETTKGFKKHEGRYIATALFLKNYFIGFEEGYITDHGIEVADTGIYDSGMDRGGYLSFLLITLACANDKKKEKLQNIKVKENIYKIKM